MKVNKSELHLKISDQISTLLTNARIAAMQAHETATHEENKAENKYDTKGLEASYLVQGQAKRVEQLEEAVETFLALKTRPVDKVMLNALVTLEDDLGNKEIMFIAPAAGGVKIDFEDDEIVIMTPASPLGRALLAKTAGDSVDVTIGRKNKSYRILSVT